MLLACVSRLLSLLSANLEESERTASALHAKCLACDKPVMGINKQVLTSKSSPLPGTDDPFRAPSPPLYDKRKEAEREKEKDKDRPYSTAKRRVAGTPLVVSAEVSVMRSTIDLPVIAVRLAAVL